MTASQRIVINSFDRDYTSYPSSTLFRIYLNAVKENVTSIRLGDAIIRNSQYNFDDYTIGGRSLKNNVLYWYENVTLVQATIPPGNYPITTLLSTLSSVMTAASTVANVYTATYNTLSGKIEFAATATPWGFDFRPIRLNSAYYQIGANEVQTPISALQQTLPRPVDLSGSPYVMIKIANIQSSVFNTSNDSAAFLVPFNTQSENVVYYEPPNSSHTAYKITTPGLTYLDIALVDDYANPINLQNSEWCFSIILE